MIKAIVFDIGGTLLDTSNNDGLSHSLNNFCKENNIEPVYVTKHFRLRKGNIEHFCENVNFKDIDKFKVFIQKNQHLFYLFPDVLPILSTLKQRGFRLVAMSNDLSLNQYTMNSYGLKEFFDLELYSYQIGSMKPELRMYHCVEKYYGFKGKQIMHVGDSIQDLIGANKAGWVNILVDRTGQRKETNLREKGNPDYVIRNLYELEHLLEQL